MSLTHSSVVDASHAQSFNPPAGSVIPPLKTHCSNCSLRDICLPCGMKPSDVDGLDDLHFSRTKVRAGETLYHEGQPFRNIYAVRMGTFKSSLTLADGREQVSGFQMAGELMG